MFHFFARVFFVSGLLLGIVLALVLSIFQKNVNNSGSTDLSNATISLVDLYRNWFEGMGLKRNRLSFDVLRYSSRPSTIYTESSYLFEKVRILCAVLIKRFNYARAANATWTKQCNRVVFIPLVEPSEEKRPKMPVRKTKANASWPLLCKALMSFSNGTFDWVLVVHDGTFAIPENARYLVAGLNPAKNHYLGHAITFWGTTYNTGEAGYLLSRGALDALRRSKDSGEEKKNKKSNPCATDSTTFWNLEDYYLGKSLAASNIYPRDTRDNSDLSTFHGFNLMKMFFPGSTVLSNYYKFSRYPTKCCSPHSVTFQVEDADKMYTFYYLLFQLQIFKEGHLGNQPPSTPRPETYLWRSFLEAQGINATYENIGAQQYYEIWKNLIGNQTLPHSTTHN